jgi:hypothetical protein
MGDGRNKKDLRPSGKGLAYNHRLPGCRGEQRPVMTAIPRQRVRTLPSYSPLEGALLRAQIFKHQESEASIHRVHLSNASRIVIDTMFVYRDDPKTAFHSHAAQTYNRIVPC